MKFSPILLLTAGSLLATPAFWGHPNVQISLGASELPFGQVVDLNLQDLVAQSPQDQIWFTGGLIGYFINEWEAPVWTTPRVPLPLDAIPQPTAAFAPPNSPPATPRTLADPPDPAQVIINPYIAPPGPPPGELPPHGTPSIPDPNNPPPGPPTGPPAPPLPPGNGPPDANPDPSALIDIPEPNLSAILALLLTVSAGAHIRSKRRR